MSRQLSCPRCPKPDAASRAASHAPARLGHGSPASRLYAQSRHGQGLSHEEATRRLREALKSYFRPA